ncbi:MAG: HU family DNA-binding protein [Pseudomonadota bacterium]
MPRATTGTARKAPAVKEPFTKTQLLSTLADNTGLTKREVAAVLEELQVVIERHVKKRAAGTFTLPGVLKIKTVRKPATKSRKMISPFTGEEITVAAKPARTMVKVQPLKALKEMVA